MELKWTSKALSDLACLSEFLALPNKLALLFFVLGRSGCPNDGGIDQGALDHHDTRFGQPAIDGLEQLPG